jgi:pimeloyl-ACP methyl ester carboxylesterase
VLDGYGIERAHLAGMSMGGALAQVVALRFLARVASVTAISTAKFTGPEEGLPGPTDSYREHAAAADDLDWSDAEAVKDFIVSDMRALAGTRHDFDEAAAREQVERDFTRAGDPLAMTNHMLLDGGGEGLDLADLEAPLLVIHGSADPFLSYAHGEALAAAVPGSRLVTIDGGGHELHPGDWDQIVEAIVAHTGSS